MAYLNGSIVHNMTNVTRASFGLPQIERVDHSIHPNFSRREKRSKDCTVPPRHREGLKQGAAHRHNADPRGGKKLRKARLTLSLRRADHDLNPSGKIPGSMKN